MPFDPRSLDISLLAELNALLDGACYDEHHVSRLLGLPTLALLSSDRFVEQAAGLEADPGPLPLLVRLLLLEQPVGRRQAELRLGREGLSLLTRLGIVAASRAPRLVADVVICPCAGAQFVTDRRLSRGAAARNGRDDRVMYLGADSYLLAYLTPAVRQGGTVLDLCTGCGVHAVLAARRGARAVGTDINRRAVAFARLNAALNGVGDRCTFLTGDLYRPLARRQLGRADLVLANSSDGSAVAPSTQASPPAKYSRFHTGAICLSRSMTKRQAANASAR